LIALCGVAAAQTRELQPVDHFPLREQGLAIRRHVEAGKPFTVAGTRGLVVGQQDGQFEAWVLPIKLLSHFSIEANVEGYTVPIDVNQAASEIEVYPDHTTITYSHIAFTLKQIMFAPDDAEDGTGAVVLFQIDSIRPVDFTFSFTPEMRPMWPERGEGTPSPEWVRHGAGGFYVLHMDFPDMAGAIAMPGTQPGILAPYQEKPHFYPLQLKLHYDPKRDGDRYFPLLMAEGTTKATAMTNVLLAKLTALDTNLRQRYEAHAARYAHMLSDLTSIQTPDAGLDDDLQWAEISIEQLRARAGDEIGLVAGYYSSGDSARPGFGWFFGRDTLYTLYAVNSFGDFTLSRQALEFLIKRQRDDGKMPHEYTQTGAYTDWKSLPYMYAAADSTPLFLTQMRDYVRASGDVEFLRQNRKAIEAAWRFETTHDTDGDGIYDNSQGTGWVESWPPGMPHQEIYLALLDQQASTAMAELSTLLGDNATSTAASARAVELRTKIESEYYMPDSQSYAFSHNLGGALDRTATIFPSIAWWNGGAGLAHAGPSFRRWASHDFSTDWGLRDMAESEPLYDPISYHQGSVWPLFTGWLSLAEYRAGHALAGYAHLMQTADQTTTQDLGAVTELLSGAYFQPFGRSTTHQLWSSSMVVTPALRGLFGIEADALHKRIQLDPHLPADWNEATVRNLHVGSSVADLSYRREGEHLTVQLKMISGEPLRLATDARDATVAKDGHSISFKLPAIELALPHGLPLPGARTAQPKVLAVNEDAHSLRLDLEAQGGTTVDFTLRRNAETHTLTADGATIVPAHDHLATNAKPSPPLPETTSSRPKARRAEAERSLYLPSAREQDDRTLEHLLVTLPPGNGYQQKTVTLHW
jgi:glycogen debranching enzyme